ncbi:MAG: GNAT family protein [Afipia sp.]|nr:GNAT family protein [Afipia sp.]
MLAGKQIVLTALRRDDAETLFSWINDPATVRFNAPYAPVHEPEHLAWLERVVADPSRIIFCIRDRQSSRLVGVIQLVDLHPIHRSAELIVRIGSDADRGRGLGVEALKLALDFAFRDRNLQRVSLKVFADNARAIRAYEKAGFEREGVLRRAVFIDGQWVDEIIMAVLADP